MDSFIAMEPGSRKTARSKSGPTRRYRTNASMSTTLGVWWPLVDPTIKENYLMHETDAPREPNEARELTPVQLFWNGSPGFKDFSPKIMKADAEGEVDEVEEAITPAPKDSSAPESVTSKDSSPPAAQPGLETPVPPLPTQTTVQSDADKENGKDNESSEEEQTPSSPPTPAPAPSLPSFSMPTNPGKNVPPAVGKPPTSD